MKFNNNNKLKSVGFSLCIYITIHPLTFDYESTIQNFASFLLYPRTLFFYIIVFFLTNSREIKIKFVDYKHN